MNNSEKQQETGEELTEGQKWDSIVNELDELYVPTVVHPHTQVLKHLREKYYAPILIASAPTMYAELQALKESNDRLKGALHKIKTLSDSNYNEVSNKMSKINSAARKALNQNI